VYVNTEIITHIKIKKVIAGIGKTQKINTNNMIIKNITINEIFMKLPHQ
jgi:hypothetical protein